MRGLGAQYYGGGVNTVKNLATLRVASNDPVDNDQIIDHYGARGMLEVEVWPGEWEGGRGTLIVETVTPNGRPGRALTCCRTPTILPPGRMAR